MPNQSTIAFDARMYGLEHAGIGRYIKNLLHHLLKKDNSNLYLIYLKKDYYQKLKLPQNTQKILADIPHYSLKEQYSFLKLIKKHPCHLIHFPHFNVPYFYNQRFVVTIHDILWHQFKGPKVTTLPPIKYTIKYQGYKRVVSHAAKKAQTIFVPSRYVKTELLDYYPQLNPNHISVTYEGVDQPFIHTKPDNSIFKKHHLPDQPYFIYTGSAYPHKNLKLLIDAIKHMNQSTNLPINLYIVSSRSVFLDQLKNYASNIKASNHLKFLGFVTDLELVALYQKAIALVHPSLSEGFGLTGLEAMSVGLPVLAAKATALPEIYGQAALFFNPHSLDDLVSNLINIKTDKKLRQSLIKKGHQHHQFFTWENTAAKTLAVYQRIIKSNNN